MHPQNPCHDSKRCPLLPLLAWPIMAGLPIQEERPGEAQENGFD